VGIGAAYQTLKARPEERVAGRKKDQLDLAKGWFDKEETKQNATLNDSQFNEVFNKIQNPTGNNATEKQANTQKAITDYLATQNITSTLPDVAKANSTKFYNAMKNLPATQRDIIFTNVPEMKAEYNTLAKTDITTNVINTKNIPETTTDLTVSTTILTDTKNKEYLDNYFTTTSDRTYTTTI